MLCAYSQNSPKVTAKMIDLAVKEIDLSLNDKNEGKSFKQGWRILLLVVLTAFTAVQAPKIFHNFNQPRESIETISEFNLSNTVPLLPRPISSTSFNNLSWFDNYPELDLSNGEFPHALKTLYAIWGYEVSLDNANCAEGDTASLQCYSENTSLQKLEQLNYPAVIELVSDEDSIYAVLYKVNKEYELLIGRQKIEVNRSWLTEYWTGELTILWQVPFDIAKPLKFGEKGDRVLWLSKQLNQVYGLSESPKSRFDWKLKNKVIEFQNDNNLVADGIVGRQTLMPLVQQLDTQIPSLL